MTLKWCKFHNSLMGGKKDIVLEIKTQVAWVPSSGNYMFLGLVGYLSWVGSLISELVYLLLCLVLGTNVKVK